MGENQDNSSELPKAPSWAVKVATFIVGIGFVALAAGWAFDPVREFYEKVRSFVTQAGEPVEPDPDCWQQYKVDKDLKKWHQCEKVRLER